MKKTYKPYSFETVGKTGEVYVRIYESMLVSPAFIDLTPKQQMLYIICKRQFYGRRKPEFDFPDITEFKGHTFYLSISEAARYGVYSSINHRRFYADMKVLEDHGFIEKVSSGRNRHAKNVYRFSEHWKEWKPV